MIENKQDAVNDDLALRDVRSVPVGDLVSAAMGDFDSALASVLRSLPEDEESMAAFQNAP